MHLIGAAPCFFDTKYSEIYERWLHHKTQVTYPVHFGNACTVKKSMIGNLEMMGYLSRTILDTGIYYEVDVTKPEGEKVNIKSMDDGRPFSLNETYTVAMTAYRANGGGELLSKGAGLSKEEMDSRILNVSEYDIRHYLMDYVKELGTIDPQPMNHWKFIPEEWAAQASKRERKILFGEGNEDDTL